MKNATKEEQLQIMEKGGIILSRTEKINKKLYRDSDNKLVGGVCSGFSCYFDVDVTVLRVLFLAALILGGFGFWIYIVVWFVAPMAKTASQKCEMRGLPINAENLRRFSNSK